MKVGLWGRILWSNTLSNVPDKECDHHTKRV